MFRRHDVVRHVKTQGLYIILATPEYGITLERGAEPAYLYQSLLISETERVWVRSAVEMEDGRFEYVDHYRGAARGRIRRNKEWAAMNASREQPPVLTDEITDDPPTA